MVLALIIGACTSKATEPTVRNVLFVGNSYTYQHDVPELFRVEASSSIRYETEVFAGPGLNLKAYVEDDRIEALLDSRDFYAIVLQDRSTASLYSKDRSEFKLALEWFRSVAEREGARLVLYQTWPRRAGHNLYEAPEGPGFLPPATPAEMMEVVAAFYTEGADSSGAVVATVGECWMRQSDLARLYASDGSHASDVGAKLAARVLARTMNGADDPCA